jgi:hypothetical protein
MFLAVCSLPPQSVWRTRYQDQAPIKNAYYISDLDFIALFMTVIVVRVWHRVDG